MATIEIEIKNEEKVDFIKQLLLEYGLQEVSENVFADANKIEKLDTIKSKKRSKN